MWFPCPTNDENSLVDIPKENYLNTTTCSYVKNCDSVRENTQKNVNGKDISVTSQFEKAKDRHVIESRECLSAPKDKDSQRLPLEETLSGVNQKLFGKEEQEKKLCANIGNKMNLNKDKPKQESLSERRKRRAVSGGGNKLLTDDNEHKKLASDDKVLHIPRNESPRSKERTLKAPEVCGIASLRLQRMKQQLEEARHLREEQTGIDGYSGFRKPVNKKTQPLVMGSTTCPPRDNKPYSLSTSATTSRSGFSGMRGGTHQFESSKGSVPNIRHDISHSPFVPSASSSSRRGNYSSERPSASMQHHPAGDNSSFFRDGSAESRRGIYPVEYKKPKMSINERALCVSEEETSVICDSRVGKDLSTGENPRVRPAAAERPKESTKETSVVQLFTRRKDVSSDGQNKSNQVPQRPQELLKQTSSCPPDNVKSSVGKSSRKRGGRGQWNSSAHDPRKVSTAPRNQECRELVPANQWGRPHKSVSFDDRVYFYDDDDVDPYRDGSYRGTAAYYYDMWVNYYRWQLRNQRMHQFEEWNEPNFYYRNQDFRGQEYFLPRENQYAQYRIVSNGQNNFNRGVRQHHFNILPGVKSFHSANYRWNHYDPRFRKNDPFWMNRKSGPLRYHVYGQQEGRGPGAVAVKMPGRLQPCRRSMGGISKVTTRVQKQMRTAAPLLKALCHRPADTKGTSIPASSPQENPNKVDSKCVVARPVKALPVDVTIEESMEWETIEPEQIVQHVGELRKQSSFQTSASSDLANLCNPNVLPSKWFIIVDTNIFLSHLSLIEELRDTKDPTLGMPTLLVPWVVLHELDCLKGSNTNPKLKTPAVRAINFVWRSLVSKHPRLEGQHPSEADNSRDVMADDSILQCCLKMKEKSEKVVLLTNDHNLQNKAIVSGVECFSAKELKKKISEHQLGAVTSEAKSPENTEKKDVICVLNQVKDCMKTILEKVLFGEMKTAYGRMWESIIARKPPLALSDVLFCLLKHWVAVFGTVLPTRCKEHFEIINEKLCKTPACSSWYNLELIIKSCCEAVEALPLHRYEKVDEAVKTLNELRKICDSKTGSGCSPEPASTSLVFLPDREAEELRSTCGSLTSNMSNISGRSGGIELHSPRTVSECTDDCLSLQASSFSEGASDIVSLDAEINSGQGIVQHYLDVIFRKVSTFCGILCQMMGIVPCVTFEQPGSLPSVEAMQQNMPLVFPCVHNLLINLQRVLAVPVQDLSEQHPVILQLYQTIKDSVPMNESEMEPLEPLHILAYCTEDNTRQSLERGVHQFEQFENIFNKAVLFFMGQNRPCPLPSF